MHQLTITRDFDLPVDELFNAWASADAVGRWFCPGDMSVPEAQVDFVEGGRYRIVMQETDGSQHIVCGTYRSIERDRRLAFTWQWENSELETSVEILFRAIDEQRSELELHHREFPEQGVCNQHEMGWNGCLNNLMEGCAA